MISLMDLKWTYDESTNIYLSTPYSHDEEEIKTRRYRASSRMAWRLMQSGYSVFSPISHSHSIEEEVQEREGHDFWMNQDLSYLEDGWTDLLVVMAAEGWRESLGVNREIVVAEDNNIPVEFVDPLEVVTLVGISGKKRSGKDTMAEVFSEQGFEQHALAEPIKDACRTIFNFTDEQLYGDQKEEYDPYWERTPREVMQHFGTDAFRETYGEDVWVDSLLQRLRLRLPAAAVVSDVRFPNEVRGIQNASGEVIRIDASERLDHEDDHASETALDDFEGYVRVVENNGSLDEFKRKAHSIAKEYAYA
jgi:hypothetical protein